MVQIPKIKKIRVGACNKCYLTYDYQHGCHFIRLILCGKHYGHVNVDKPLVNLGSGLLMAKEMKK